MAVAPGTPSARFDGAARAYSVSRYLCWPSGGQGPAYFASPKPLAACTAPVGTRPAAMPVLAGSRPATTQWTKSVASRSTREMASSFVLAGTPLQEMAGDVSAPLHVYWASMNPPSTQGAVTTNP